jgi:16S rRNA processing protein RimM
LDYYLVARVEQLYGKEGFVRLKLFSDFPERYLSLKEVFIDFWGDKKRFYVEDAKDVKGKIIIKFKNFNTPREINTLIGRDVYVSEDDVIDLPADHFFIHDLIGSEVFGGNERLGIITDVIKGKANDVLVISDEDGEEKMLPFVLNFIEKFDAASKKLILNISKEFFTDDED